jgi:hypothetical protein
MMEGRGLRVGLVSFIREGEGAEELIVKKGCRKIMIYKG